MALGLCADALVRILGGAGQVSAEPAAAPVAAAERRSWSLGIDGWRIEIDAAEVERRATANRARSAATAGPRRGFPYEALIARYAEETGIDWRLVSAVIYEESRFQADSESPAGAYGLMQVREIAARDVGETEFRAPESNIRTGVRYLRSLLETFAAADERDQRALALAAYNMGPAHVQDAQSLARRYGYDPLVWDASMAAILPLLEDPRLYRTLPNGFAQGRQTVAYVERVLRRFDAYRRTLTSLPARPPDTLLD
jgi:membrane-bound lytic murein transglycosylase F